MTVGQSQLVCPKTGIFLPQSNQQEQQKPRQNLSPTSATTRVNKTPRLNVGHPQPPDCPKTGTFLAEPATAGTEETFFRRLLPQQHSGNETAGSMQKAAKMKGRGVREGRRRRQLGRNAVTTSTRPRVCIRPTSVTLRAS